MNLEEKEKLRAKEDAEPNSNTVAQETRMSMIMPLWGGAEAYNSNRMHDLRDRGNAVQKNDAGSKSLNLMKSIQSLQSQLASSPSAKSNMDEEEADEDTQMRGTTKISSLNGQINS